MKANQIIKWSSQGFVILSALSFLYVSILGFVNPQSVMDLVGVILPNNDAFSSIRGIYGGVGLAIVIMLAYLLIKDLYKSVLFLSLIWGGYAISRVMTIGVEGSLGAFGKQWLLIESLFFLISILLLTFQKKLLTPR